MNITAEQIRNQLREGNDIEPIKNGAHIILINDGKHFSSTIEGLGRNLVDMLLYQMLEHPDFAILLKGTIKEYEDLRKYQEAAEKAVGHIDKILEGLDRLKEYLQETDKEDNKSKNRKPRHHGKQHKS